VLDLVEEPLDQVASPVKIRTKAQRLSPISFWWNIRPCAVLANKGSDPICIIATVGEQHCSRLQAAFGLSSLRGACGACGNAPMVRQTPIYRRASASISVHQRASVQVRHE
jgi:hypothetical protein